MCHVLKQEQWWRWKGVQYRGEVIPDSDSNSTHVVMRREIFQNILPYSRVWERFHCFAPSEAWNLEDIKIKVELVLEAFIDAHHVEKNSYVFGPSVVFFRNRILNQLEEARVRLLYSNATKIESQYRAMKQRRRFLTIKNLATKLQHLQREKKYNNVYFPMYNTSVVLQSLYRMRKARNQYRELVQAIIKIQSFMRKWMVLYRCKKMQAASLKIQCRVRIMISKRIFKSCMAKEKKRIQYKLSSLRQDNVSLQTEVTTLEKEMESLTSDLEEECKRRRSAENANRGLSAKLLCLEHDINNLSSIEEEYACLQIDVTMLENEVESLKSKLEEEYKSRECAESRSIELGEKLSLLERTLDNLSSIEEDFKFTLEENNKLKCQLVEMQESNSALRKDHYLLVQEHCKLQGDLEQRHAKINALQNDIAKKEDALLQMEQSMSLSRKETQDKDTHIQDLEEQIALLRKQNEHMNSDLLGLISSYHSFNSMESRDDSEAMPPVQGSRCTDPPNTPNRPKQDKIEQDVQENKQHQLLQPEIDRLEKEISSLHSKLKERDDDLKKAKDDKILFIQLQTELQTTKKDVSESEMKFKEQLKACEDKIALQKEKISSLQGEKYSSIEAIHSLEHKLALLQREIQNRDEATAFESDRVAKLVSKSKETERELEIKGIQLLGRQENDQIIQEQKKTITELKECNLSMGRNNQLLQETLTVNDRIIQEQEKSILELKESQLSLGNQIKLMRESTISTDKDAQHKEQYISDLNVEISSLNEAFAYTKDQMTGLEEQMNLDKEVIQKLRDEVQASHENEHRLSQLIATIEDERDKLQLHIATLEGKLQSNADALSELSDERSSLSMMYVEDSQNLREKISNLEDQLKVSRSQGLKTIGRLHELEREKELNEGEIKLLEMEKDSLQERVDFLLLELEAGKENTEEINAQLSKLNSENQTLEHDIEELKKSRSDLWNKVQAVKIEKKFAKNCSKSLLKTNKELLSDLNNLKLVHARKSK
ncbi:predicted protein [Chaetoceros tenuissimus]|uniref:Myosin motor domain-containing protein n=1 Tax=Chaetoceros tenuissimus TaxID=426638 RepID=A0AAD3CWF3_9STRA|nr:predicted protein [Chaetoceros tenuissimus]